MRIGCLGGTRDATRDATRLHDTFAKRSCGQATRRHALTKTVHEEQASLRRSAVQHTSLVRARKQAALAVYDDKFSGQPIPKRIGHHDLRSEVADLHLS